MLEVVQPFPACNNTCFGWLTNKAIINPKNCSLRRLSMHRIQKKAFGG